MTTKTHIQNALAGITNSNFAETSGDLLGALGYRYQNPVLWSGSSHDFIARRSTNPGTQSEKDFLINARFVHILYQLTDAAIQEDNTSLFADTLQLNTGNARSFLFVSVELSGTTYPRGRYAAFTREINKGSQIPTIVLFKTADCRLTLAFVHRREHKRNPERDVLGHVSLIREIDPIRPHRAHLDILAELHLAERLRWMNTHDKSKNFDGLLDAWLDALNTEELNRRFYRELFDWFNKAVTDAKFPIDKSTSIEQQVIRLITRILFIWFIKEKGLVSKEWFVLSEIKNLLYNFGGSDYYRAVLQNLFFAALNTEIDVRGFSTRTEPSHRVFSRFRYESLIRDRNRFETLMGQTPFINGGLFDCLDDEESQSAGGQRIDMFSDPNPHDGLRAAEARREAWHQLNVPDALFFDNTYGLFPLLDRYKFTVEENTPVEQEVALDPELLGKVFENLLAAYNPETRDTARRQTGSYYTPGAVVDYMVDEALITVLSEQVHPAVGDANFLQDRLRYLLDYADAFEDANDLFENSEKESIVRAIAEIKVLDPAVGSGAFPMGILHKLTLALRRLDPRNELWEKFQQELASQRAKSAFDTSDQSERDAELCEISDTFERYRDSDFGRKLYLIQNGIYGVDIQPIATQIAKLRFFISLAIDQESTDSAADNYGIRPLPNLETRFVAADTLLRLDKPAQLGLQSDIVNQLEQDLNENRERHFHATTRQQKVECRKTDKKLRKKLAMELQNAGFLSAVAEKIAHWNPYDQNTCADWFEPEYMFGMKKGFDIIIGNPPYIQLQKNSGKLGKYYKDIDYKTFARTGDIYQLFYERGSQLLKSNTGVLVYITSNSWLKAEYGKFLRHYFSEEHTPLSLLEMGKDVFANAIVDTNILILRAGRHNINGKAIDMDRLSDKTFPPSIPLWGRLRLKGQKPWIGLSMTEWSIMEKMEAIGTPLKEWDIDIYRGITTGLNAAFIIDNETKEALVAEDPRSAEIIKPVLRGRDIKRYRAEWAGLWLLCIQKGINIKNYPAIHNHLLRYKLQLSKKAGNNKWYELQASPSNKVNSQFGNEKLIWMDLTNKARFAYDVDGMFCLNTAFVMSGESIKYLCSLLNSKLITWFMGKTALNSGMGITRWINASVSFIPIPQISTAQQHIFVRLIDSILLKKRANLNNIFILESEIDSYVYKLYKLTSVEISTIEEQVL